MKLRGGIVIGIILLFVGLTISPATGSIFEADESTQITLQNEETISIYFLDTTGKYVQEKVIEMTKTEYSNLREEIRIVKTTSKSLEESLNAQFSVFQQHGFIDEDVSYELIKEKADAKFANKPHRTPRAPLANNLIFNMVCAISFELDSGNTFVFGLSTFMNFLGFNIISVHNGHSPDGISTLGGLLAQETDPGDYAGIMFGFFGYWMGTKTGTGTYSDLIAAGFTVLTIWLPTSI